MRPGKTFLLAFLAERGWARRHGIFFARVTYINLYNKGSTDLFNALYSFVNFATPFLSVLTTKNTPEFTLSVLIYATISPSIFRNKISP